MCYSYIFDMLCCCVTVKELISCVAVLLLQYRYGVFLCYCYSIHMVCSYVTLTVLIRCVAVLFLSISMVCCCVTLTVSYGVFLC